MRLEKALSDRMGKEGREGHQSDVFYNASYTDQTKPGFLESSSSKSRVLKVFKTRIYNINGPGSFQDSEYSFSDEIFL